ncbi:hypothetical protein EI94DRAFT_1082519 [Lactarius quietus]|nr:hypothetical protein EI94DRAFT_1082519 [Lactarius quietus]
MLVFIVSRLLTGWFVFLLPSYCTFKALRQRPLNERELEKWAGYWTVAGILVAFEYTAEWSSAGFRSTGKPRPCSFFFSPFPNSRARPMSTSSISNHSSSKMRKKLTKLSPPPATKPSSSSTHASALFGTSSIVC